MLHLYRHAHNVLCISGKSLAQCQVSEIFNMLYYPRCYVNKRFPEIRQVCVCAWDGVGGRET